MKKLHFLFLLLKKQSRRAVSPVIATVLLIALVIIAGFLVSLILFSTLTAPRPLVLSITDIDQFTTTDDDQLIDQFRVILSNTGTIRGLILVNSFQVYNVTSGTEEKLEGWQANITENVPILEGQSLSLLLHSNSKEFQLEANKTKIVIEFSAKRADSPNDKPKTFSNRFSPLLVPPTKGPVIVNVIKRTAPFLSINATNLGLLSVDVTIQVDFPTDLSLVNNTNFLTATINGGTSITETWQFNGTVGATYVLVITAFDAVTRQIFEQELVVMQF